MHDLRYILYTHIENIKNLLNGPAGLFTFETCIVVYPLKKFQKIVKWTSWSI